METSLSLAGAGGTVFHVLMKGCPQRAGRGSRAERIGFAVSYAVILGIDIE
jgi:hypothetical protein